MTTGYQEKHYEDVARILRADRMEARIRPEDDALANVIADFADLFAADNPMRCTFHGDHNIGYSAGCKITGFNRKQFLEACGLKKEG